MTDDDPRNAPLAGLSLDLDGTLTDTLDMCLRSFQDAVEERTGRRPTSAEVVAGFGANEEGILAKLVGGRDPVLEEAWYARYEQMLAEEIPGPFPGVEALLQAVAARGVKIAIVTGKGPRSARHTLEHFGLMGYVDRIEAGGPDGCIKADRLADVLADWGLPPASVAHVGDTAMDLRAARATGVRAIAAGWASTTDAAALRQEPSDLQFDSFDEFAAWVVERLPAAPSE